MSNILYLVHRIPFPPNKGDKVRSFNLLKYLSSQHRVYLGTFVDDPLDWQYVPKVEEFCEETFFSEIKPFRSKLKSISAFFDGSPLTVKYYRDARFKRWVNDLVAQKKIDKIVIFSSAMSQYVDDVVNLDILVDFVDVDSLKWSEYASKRIFPMSFIYQRESDKLLKYERFIAKRSKQSFFVTDNESELFKKLAPESAALVSTINNGVDSEYFSVDQNRQSPYPSVNDHYLVFTGAMDYWPNIDAVVWFATDVFPRLRNLRKNLYFYIVGRNPSAQVLALASDSVIVTGEVPDVRPYLQFSSVVVAPLRVARGIQNKILEAMAMERPVVASAACVGAMDVDAGQDILSASGVDDFLEKIDDLLNSSTYAKSIGHAGRCKVLEKYSWNAHLSKIDCYLDMANV